MKTRLFSGVPLVLLATACAATHFHKDGATVAQFDQEKAECEYEALKYSPIGRFDSALEVGFRRLEITQTCLRMKGWQQQ